MCNISSGTPSVKTLDPKTVATWTVLHDGFGFWMMTSTTIFVLTTEFQLKLAFSFGKGHKSAYKADS